MALGIVARHTILNEMRAIEIVVRAILREAAIKRGMPSRTLFAGRVREMAGSDPLIMGLVEPMLCVLAAMLVEGTTHFLHMLDSGGAFDRVIPKADGIIGNLGNRFLAGTAGAGVSLHEISWLGN